MLSNLRPEDSSVIEDFTQHVTLLWHFVIYVRELKLLRIATATRVQTLTGEFGQKVPPFSCSAGSSNCSISDSDNGGQHLKSELLFSQCSVCDSDKCPPSEAYPHMTAFDDALIAGSLQSDCELERQRFKNYMSKCSSKSYLTVDNHGTVNLRALESLESLAEADWKSINPPKKLNHREFRFWMSRSTGKCLTVFGGKAEKRNVGVSDGKFDGSNPYQLFAFRFHFHKAFCCCGQYNE
ncbi:Hypothetical predicted protein [Olea europaea subsp. europaea]|uniref:Uncharacterized protein n=1 Tax=Olea europaea subsp. europaea TaxID=158383 RepID=A0A8S0PU62_OLEEU|nr:Hypothetical predicted protein [Olea europaea subsp. europaea]